MLKEQLCVIFPKKGEHVRVFVMWARTLRPLHPDKMDRNQSEFEAAENLNLVKLLKTYHVNYDMSPFRDLKMTTES